jgi:hypothetical protein
MLFLVRIIIFNVTLSVCVYRVLQADNMRIVDYADL